MTLKEALEQGQEQLKRACIQDAELDAWYLLEHVTGVSRSMYFMDRNQEVESEKEAYYFELIGKRCSHIPLQHLTGVQEFMGFEFQVNEHVLIPRQDTEVLVEEVLKELKPGMKVLDMCTGSGCILISLLKMFGQVEGAGADVSEKALAVAKANAKNLGVKAAFIESNLFSNIEDMYDVIVSNPPYIRTAVIEELEEEVKIHDPMLALDGKEDGLYFYRKIIDDSRNYLNRGGRLYFEIGHDQGNDVSGLMRDAGFHEVTVKKDLAGLDRVVFGVYI